MTETHRVGIFVTKETEKRLETVPEDILDPDDLINFLLDFYFKNAELSKAQQILTEEK